MFNRAVCFLGWYWSLDLLCLNRVKNYFSLEQTKTLWSKYVSELLKILSSGVEPGIFFSYLGFLGSVWGELGVWDWDGCLVLVLLTNLQWKWVSVSISVPGQQPSQTRLSLLTFCFSFWSCSAVQQVILECPRWKWEGKRQRKFDSQVAAYKEVLWLLLVGWFVIS